MITKFFEELFSEFYPKPKPKESYKIKWSDYYNNKKDNYTIYENGGYIFYYPNDITYKATESTATGQYVTYQTYGTSTWDIDTSWGTSSGTTYSY